MERSAGTKTLINNDFYDTLDELWYTAIDHPIALLRAENRLRSHWIMGEIQKNVGPKAKVLDVGCGAGFLSNHLALHDYDVTGIDLSKSSLNIAQKKDITKRARYLYGDACKLPFEEQYFDVVCATDILEHVENPGELIRQASKVLKPGGLFFFHTFNRNWLSFFFIIKGVEWFVKNTPKNMHSYKLFIKPKELESLCALNNLQVQSLKGFVPNMWNRAFWKMLLTRKVSENFSFAFIKSLSTGYCGIAKKND